MLADNDGITALVVQILHTKETCQSLPIAQLVLMMTLTHIMVLLHERQMLQLRGFQTLNDLMWSDSSD